jgi:hypothetical protein
MKSFVFKLLRTVFGLYLVYLGIIQLQNSESLQKTIPTTINYLQNQILIPREIVVELDTISNNAPEIVNFYVINMILSGVLIFFGFRLGKFILTISIILDLLFIHNYAHYDNNIDHISNTSKLITILGGSYYI